MRNTFYILTYIIVILLNLFNWSLSVSATNLPKKYTTTYFSSKNGVEDGLVNDMIQDHKGLLWFATWNGLYRFDGYNFQNYKSSTKDQGGLTNDRLLEINEDKYGCIWVLCYDSTAYRFNPGSETFDPIPKASSVNFQSIQVLSNGVTWLLFTDGSAIRAHTHPVDLSLALDVYSDKDNVLPSGKIHAVYLDSTEQEWILTDNGLYQLKDRQLSTIVPGTSHSAASFYTAKEQGDSLLFGGNNGKIYTYSLSRKAIRVEQLKTSASVISILGGTGKTLYITDKDGVFMSNPADHSYRHFRLDHLMKRKDKSIESAMITNNHLLWITHPDPGVTLFDLQQLEFHEFVGKDEAKRPLCTETGFFAIEDPNNVLWIHPKGGGLSYYDAQRKALIPFNTTDQSIKWKSNDRCFSAFSDKQGNLWMSTQLNRLQRVTFISDKFHFHMPSPEDPDLPENEIRALYTDKKGRIWTGSRDLNVSVYDAQFNLLHSFRAGKVYAITQDSDDVFWISTKGEGLIRVVETASGHFKTEQYTHDPNNLHSISHNNIYFTFQDRKKRLWVATYGGGLNLIEQQADGSLHFINHQNGLKNYPIQRFYKVRHITEDSVGNIWVSTTAGILHFNENFREPETIVFDQINREQGDVNSLNNNDVHMIKCTSKGRIYAVTYGGGLNEIIKTAQGSYQCEAFTQENGLISDIIYAVEEDRNGNLWLATGGGLVKFVHSQEQIQYPSEHIAFNMHFSEGVGSMDKERILFGTNRGIFYFTPGKINQTDFVPQIFFSSIWVNNEELTPKETPEILPTSIDNSQQVTLPPNNHSLRITFSALNMTNTEYTHYAYMLRGFDKTYRYTDQGHEANYTNLPPGKYIFSVKSTNSEGVWVDNERTLSIEVLPTFSETPLASFLLFLLILIIALTVMYIYTVFYRMKQKVRNEEYLAQLKLNFFTDVSHELRTPLTLITGPLDFILNTETLPEKLRESLSMIRKNSERMQRLVGQILDFSKIQDQKMRLRVQYTDIVRFAQGVVEHFMGLASERHITLRFSSGPSDCYLWIDEDKIEKVIFNLLSNAFKYTPDHKHIQVDVTETQHTVSIKVTDQGVGIPEEKQKSIFNRFENFIQKKSNNSPSSGIGLSLAKELTEMHQGLISVESKIGEGSAFTIILLKGKEHYPADTEYIVDDLKNGNPIAPIVITPEEETESEPGNGNELRMLIVEDNQELRIFIKQVFQDKYHITEARDGSEGLEKAFATLPDIIITDIMMPVKDGIQMLQELRHDERTSHIPAIVLTAKSDLDSVLIGIQTGADDYITKPFSIHYLQLKVDNLLAQRKKLQVFYSQNKIENISKEEEQATQLSEKDMAFLSKLGEVMEEQMNNPDLNVDTVVDHFNLSRTIFFHKLKSLTGLSPILYIRDVRMRRAAELIRQQQYTMAEIAYMVGYNDPHYFSKSFKAFWGMTATEYAKRTFQG
ncbi:two-component regulator propeller domain-containing protein [Bacteroides sp. 51]|uniref:two-component regulator propeller domain-containing protein n=1 Tax=Bacteroides sp. 51 TaxID=2302938 RepID=UPI001EF3B858|nr:two-component regulator propeller domain-containing protein [Bacteroides sp. 51]